MNQLEDDPRRRQDAESEIRTTVVRTDAKHPGIRSIWDRSQSIASSAWPRNASATMIRILLTAVFAAFGARAHASPPDNITDAEMALLPKYCPYTQTFNPGIRKAARNHPQAERWLAMVGPGYWSLHHYCWALIQQQRAARRTANAMEKHHYLQAALSNFWFVVKNSPPDMILLPEIYTWIGRTEDQLDHYDNAYDAFRKARELKKDYWPAYFHWAESLITRNRRSEALPIVAAGLEVAPDAAPLREQMKELKKN